MELYHQYKHDLGETETRRLEDDEVMAQLPPGYWVEQTGAWYVAYFGDTWYSRPKTALVKAVEQCWTHYNGTGRRSEGVAQFFRGGVSIDKEVRQMSIDDLL